LNTPKTSKQIFQTLLDIIAIIYQNKPSRISIAGVGIGIAGQIDPSKYQVVNAPNIPSLSDISFQSLEKKLRLPVVIRNDAQCFTLGEALYGAGKGKSLVCGVTIGTGVGGGIVYKGQAFTGAHFTAGEIGHIQIVPDGLQCACDNQGCLEQYINKAAISARYRKLTGRNASPKEIEQESYQKKKSNPALQVVEETGRILGQALSIVSKVVDPAIFILGGGIAKTKTLYAPANAEFKKQALLSQKKIPIVASSLGGTKAGIIGAALEARLAARQAKRNL
jgi:predicted NBD/HSP70 family sugar kinase